MFGKLFAHRPSRLVTCIVQREGASWQATWASGGRVPADFSDASLTAAVERATTGVATIYQNQPIAAQAELQLAIYPWADTTAKVILDINSDSEGFMARDVEGSGVLVRSESLESLVGEAEKRLPDRHDAMLRWVRPVSTLPVS